MQNVTGETLPDGWDAGATPGEMGDLLDQLICKRDAFDLEEMRAERAVRELVRNESRAYLGLMPESWPPLYLELGLLVQGAALHAATRALCQALLVHL